MFTVEQRDAVRQRVLSLAQDDRRVVAGAVVGSLALGAGDRFSDLDLTFAVADGTSVADVLDDWTRTLSNELAALHLFDLHDGPTTYRVFLLPHALQFDLSMTPASRFRPTSRRFRLVFGKTVGEAADATPLRRASGDIFGWGVVYALHARACIERGRVWQAEHYVNAVRDRALSLACIRLGLPAGEARGYDDLPVEVLARLDQTHMASLEPNELRRALAVAMRALLDEGQKADVPTAGASAQRLPELH